MSNAAIIWPRLARGLRRKINFAHCLDRSAVAMVISAGVAATALLLLRNHWSEAESTWLLVSALLLPILAFACTWFIAKKNFLSMDGAFIRLERHYGLHAALSTAHSNAGEWPAIPTQKNDGLSWRWLRAGLPPLLAISLVATAWLVPVTTGTPTAQVSEPAAWNVVESDLKALVEKKLADEKSTEKAKEAIDALRKRPQGEWFDHSSIEASDRLLQNHQRNMSKLEGRMRDAARAMRDAAEARQVQGLKPGESPAEQAFAQAVAGMRMGNLIPDKELLKKLEELQGEDGMNLNNLDRRQLAELLDHMDQNAEKLQEMLEKFQGMPDGDPDGNGEPGNGENGDQLGEGGEPQRGPGEGGKLLGDEKDGVQAQRDKPLPAGDLSRAALGDRLGEQQATHDIDSDASPELSAGGAPVQPGDGGGAVWNDSLHPSEQKALRRFFE